MNKIKSAVLVLALTAVSGVLYAAEMSKEEAIAKALEMHPGTVDKAYQETKKGELLWEVKIHGDDGKKWETFFKVSDGEFVTEKIDD